MALDPDSQRALNEIIDELRELTLVMRQLGRTMSAIGDDEIKAFGRETERAAEEVKDLGSEAKKSAGLVDQYGREIKSATKATEEATQATEQDTKATEESTRSKRQLTKEEFVYRRAQRSAFRDLAEEFSTTRGATARLQEGLFSATRSSELMQGSILLVESGLRGLAKATTSMARDLYAGQRGAQVSARALNLLGKELGDTLQGVGAAASMFALFSLFTPQLKLFGVAISGVRKGLAFLGAGLAALGITTKIATELNEIAAEQNDQLMKTYRDLSRAGIGVAGGLNQLFDILQLSGATRDEFEQFAAQLGASSQQLAFLGTTTGDAMRSFAEVAGDLRRSDLGQQLEMLGIQAEEQRELVMGYMTQQARLGRLERMTREQLIQGSNRYARELDQLAQLTGASRKEQQDAREALLADERLRAAIVSARLRGDQQELARLEEARELAAAVRTAGSQDLGTAIAQIAASGGALSSDMSVMGEMTGRITEVLAADGDLTAKLTMLVGNLEQNQQQLSETNRFVGTIAGYQINLVQIADIVDRIGPAIKEAQRLGVPLQDILDQQQREREQGDKALRDNVEAARMGDNASRLMSAAVETFNYSATVHRTASELFQSAVNTFVSAVGVDQPQGGLASVGGRTPSQTVAPPSPVGTEAERTRDQRLQQQLENRPGTARADPGDQRGGLLQRGLGALGLTAGRSGARGQAPASTPASDQVTGILGPDQLFDFRGGVSGYRANFDALEPSFRADLLDMAREYYEQSGGKKLPFGSGQRNEVENQEVGGVANSRHIQGTAVDLTQAAVKELEKMGLLQIYGFKRRSSPWHISRDGYKDGGIISARSGGVPITVGEGGQNEAVVPLPDGKSIPVQLDQSLQDASRSTDLAMQTRLSNMMRDFADIRPAIDTSGIIAQINQDLGSIVVPELDVAAQVAKINQDLSSIAVPELDIAAQVAKINQDLDSITLPDLDVRPQVSKINQDLGAVALPDLDISSQVSRINQDLANITLPDLDVRALDRPSDTRDIASVADTFGQRLDAAVTQSLARLQQMPPEDIAMRVAAAVSSEFKQARSMAQTVTGAVQDPNLDSVGKAVSLVNAELGQAMMAANTISSAAQSPDMKSMAAVLGFINPNLGKAVRAADAATADAASIDRALDVLAIVIPKFGLVLEALRTMSGLLPKEPAGLVTDTATALAPEAADITAPIMRLTTALESFDMPPAPEPAVPTRSDVDRKLESIMTRQADIMASQTSKLDEIAASMRAQVNMSGRILQVSQN